MKTRIYASIQRWRLRRLQKAIKPLLLARAREICLRDLGRVPADLDIRFGTTLGSKVGAISKDFGDNSP